MKQDLIETVLGYATESALSPLRQEKSAAGLKSEENISTWESIVAILLSEDQDNDYFQSEIARYHGHALSDAIVEQALVSLKHPTLLAAQKNGHAGALEKRLFDFRVLTSYLTHKQCSTLVNHELSIMAKNAEFGCRQQYADNMGLLIELIKKINPAKERERRWRELECRKAELLLKQSKACANSENSVMSGVFDIKATQRFCQLREKRRVIELMTRLIEQYPVETDKCISGIVRFFDKAKELCQTYPVDITSYANLLFVIDSACRKFSSWTLLKELYQEILENYGELLPKAYRAKLLYTQAMAEADSAEPLRNVVPRISSAIRYFDSIFLNMMTPADPSVLLTEDLSCAEYLQCYASLFHLLARLAGTELGKWEQMPLQQQDELAALFSDHATITDRHLFLSHACASLLHPTTRTESPFDQIVHNVTGYLKRSLNLLILAHTREQHKDLTEKLAVYHFNKLVGIYISHDKTAALEQLLAKKNVVDFMQFSGFDTQLPIWRKSLRAMKRAMRGHAIEE